MGIILAQTNGWQSHARYSAVPGKICIYQQRQLLTPCINALLYSICPCTQVASLSVDILEKIESKTKQDIPGMNRINNLLENNLSSCMTVKHPFLSQRCHVQSSIFSFNIFPFIVSLFTVSAVNLHIVVYKLVPVRKAERYSQDRN
jgi:hypothetical protein